MNLVSNFAERFSEATKNMSCTQIADKLGISKQSASAYINGTRTPKRLTISSIAQILKVSPAWLMGYDVSPQNDLHEQQSSYPDIYVPKLKKVPLLGITACGEPIYTQSFENGFTMIGEEFDVDFALQTKGDSMTGIGINDGDIVFFKECTMVDNGQIAAVFVDDETTLKRVYYYKDEQKLLLVAENSQYAPLLFQGEQLDHIRIIGLAVAHMRKL